jgi:hypothetical protein
VDVQLAKTMLHPPRMAVALRELPLPMTRLLGLQQGGRTWKTVNSQVSQRQGCSVLQCLVRQSYCMLSQARFKMGRTRLEPIDHFVR